MLATGRCVASSNAVAVWVRLCGSTPIVITYSSSTFLLAEREAADDTPTCSTDDDHASVESGRGRTPNG